MKDDIELNFYTIDEIGKLIKERDIERLVFVDTGVEEVLARYRDLPDIIVDFFDKYQFPDLTVYDFKTDEKLLTTFGPFLNKCKPEVREEIIERLVGLQREEIEVKDYKVINIEDLLEYYRSRNEER